MRRRHAGSSLSQLRLGNFMKSYLVDPEKAILSNIEVEHGRVSVLEG
jgi:hypothetical protein